jgi:hypothetical protein
MSTTIVVTGATGFIGRALVQRLLGLGHRVRALVRDQARARALLGPDVELLAAADLGAAIADADAAINLAGESIAGGRWTARRRRRITASRLDTTRALVAAIRARPTPLPVLVSASAVGVYGDRGEAELTEEAAAGRGFAADLCRAWEAEAAAARGAARRVVCARLGVVLGRGGGALTALTRIARLGLGGPVAGGRQWLAWVHLDDAVGALVFALTAPLDGPVNVVAPAPVRQGDLARALGRHHRRPAVLPTPGLALRAALGEAATLVTASARVVPAELVRAGYRFGFPALDAALAELTADAGVVIAPARGPLPDATYLARRRPTHVLCVRTRIERPLAEVFPFFAAAENLAVITPPAMGFEIQTPRPIAMGEGAVIDYRLRALGAPIRWRTVIERWTPGERFVDAQARGPYRAWWHEHSFAADGDATIMTDTVYYAAPLGPLGRLVNRLLIGDQLREIFGYRAAVIRQRFPPRHQVAPAPGPALVGSESSKYASL